MEVPYILNFGQGFKKQVNESHQLPDWCEYPLAFASHSQCYVSEQFEMLGQQLNSEPFFIDFIQVNVRKPSYIQFDINERQLFLYFMLKGTILYVNETQKPIIRTHANSFLMSYYDTGSYFAYVEEGVHTALVVSILPEWIESMYHNYPNLQNILHRFKHDTNSYDTMYQCRMDRKIHRWIYKIYSYSQNNIGAVDGNLRKYISYLLEYYDSVLQNQNSDLAFKIKDYIQEHYREDALTVKFLADYFFVTERTMLNIFKRQYHMSVQEFITELRITHALELMEQQGMNIKDVYMEVGYADERSFRSALERYQKRR